MPSCANDWLLREKLRGEWQFNGYVTSDCDADSDVFYSHHYSATPEQAVADVLRCGSHRHVALASAHSHAPPGPARTSTAVRSCPSSRRVPWTKAL